MNRPMRILHCIPSLQTGGAEPQLAALASRFQQQGHQVHVAYLHDGPHLGTLQQAGVNLHRLGLTSSYDPRIMRRLIHLIRRERVDLVQSWLLLMDIWGGLASLWTNTPWILSERNSGVMYSRYRRFLLRRCLGRFADAVVANSAAGLDYWRRVLPTSTYRAVIPNAVPVERIAQASPLDDACRRCGDGPIILYVGRLAWEKNIDVLFDSVERVLHRQQGGFVVIGDGHLADEVRRRVERSDVSDRIHLMGRQEPSVIYGWMKSADLLISVSVTEGHPNVVLEAMAAGCPLVVSDIPSHRDAVGSAGRYAPVDDPHAIAATIRQVLAEPEQSARRVEQARRIVEGYSLDAMADRYGHLYQELLANCSPRQ